MTASTVHDVSFQTEISVKVTNTGPVVGSEVVQVYVTLPDIGLTTPALQLRGFAKAKNVNPGQSQAVKIHLDKYAVSFWDTRRNLWAAKAGTYGLSVGRSSASLSLEGSLVLEKDLEWSGL